LSHLSIRWRKERDYSSQHQVSKGKNNLFLSCRAQPGWSCCVSFRKPRWWLEGAGDEKRESGRERESSGLASSSPLLPGVNKGVWDLRQHKRGQSWMLQSRGLVVWVCVARFW